ncbi:hypothetical protein H4Q26_008159 [Puccinia striiformis f. sp. tritici PST-130]|nr:hypothetical protein H4Q26_008159 [Puccinia striiformis f. sp. tritici PST-130]
MDPISSSQNAISKEAIPEHVQIINICEYINCHELSPKKKNLAFLKNKNDTLVNRQSKWPSSGLHLTMELVDELVTLVTRSQEGHEKWENWVLREAVNILDRQKPDSGYYPNGLYQRSTTVTAKFLNDQTTREYNHRLTRDGIPFLLNFSSKLFSRSTEEILTALMNSFENETKALEEETGELNKNLDDNEAEGLDMEAIGYKQLPSSQLRARDRFNRIARLVCGMIAYARNCCHNGMQLRTAIQLVACGVTDRVNHYLMYHSLVCGQQTAMSSLKNLSLKGESRLKDLFAAHCGGIYKFSPIICIDNLDIKEHVHTHAVGNHTRTFHGTWGTFIALIKIS